MRKLVGEEGEKGEGEGEGRREVGMPARLILRCNDKWFQYKYIHAYNHTFTYTHAHNVHTHTIKQPFTNTHTQRHKYIHTKTYEKKHTSEEIKRPSPPMNARNVSQKKSKVPKDKEDLDAVPSPRQSQEKVPGRQKGQTRRSTRSSR